MRSWDVPVAEGVGVCGLCIHVEAIGVGSYVFVLSTGDPIFSGSFKLFLFSCLISIEAASVLSLGETVVVIQVDSVLWCLDGVDDEEMAVFDVGI